MNNIKISYSRNNNSDSSAPINGFWTDRRLRNEKNDVIVGERLFPLTPSKSKYLAVGLSRDNGFRPCVMLGGCRGEYLLFTEKAWQELLENQQSITNLFYGGNEYIAADVVNTSQHTVSYETFKDIQIVKISDKGGRYIYLGQETLCRLFDSKPLIHHLISTFKKCDFPKYLSLIMEEMKQLYGNLKDNILKKISNIHCDNSCILIELITLYPDLTEFQIQPPSYFHIENEASKGSYY